YYSAEFSGGRGILVSGTVSTTSDRRLKKDIRSYGDGLSLIEKIRTVRFKYNGLGETSESSEDQIGVIAQEVKEIAPHLVSTRKVKLRETDKEETEILAVRSSAFTY